MRRLLMLFLAVCIITALSNVVHAFPNSVTVDGRNDAGPDFTYGFFESFETGLYEIAVDSGAWSTWNVGTVALPAEGWLWSLSVYQPGTDIQDLGNYSYNGFSDPNDGVFFPANPLIPADVEAAKSGALNASIGDSIFINVSDPSENIYFYIKEHKDLIHENRGSVIVAITTPTVVPEPVSSTLFVLGGTVFACRRFIKKRKARLQRKSA